MKLFLLLFCFVVNVSIAQSSFNEKAAKKLIETFFEGFHKGDTVLMRSVMTKGMTLHSVFKGKDGSNELAVSNVNKFMESIATRPKDEKWEEKILDFKGFKDGNLGLVWTNYEFWLNGKFSHCGANSFTLINTNKGWKIMSIVDSRRREGCNQ